MGTNVTKVRVKGVVYDLNKLYDTTGSNTDGGMTQSAITECFDNVIDLVNDVESSFSSISITEEEGFTVTDNNGKVGMKYDENGFDVAKLSTHFKTSLLDIVKMSMPYCVKVMEHGFYVVDADGNIGMKYDEDGLSCALVDDVPIISGSSAKEIKILFIGNSFSIDNCVYLPRLIEANSGITLIIGVLYLSGMNIEGHINRFNNETPYYYFEYKSTNGYWTSSGSANTTIKNALDNGNKWNIIMTHQASDLSDRETTIINNEGTGLQTLTSLVNGYIGYKPIWGYVLTNPKKSTEGEITYGDTMWGTMCSICQTLVSNGIVDFIVPSGTAIQNGRTNQELDAYGSAGHITSDGAHMEDGIGRLIGSYVLYLSLFRIFGDMKPLAEIDWKPIWGTNVFALSDSSTSNTDPNVYPQTSSFGTITSSALTSAKSASEHAYKTPYTKTTIL